MRTCRKEDIRQEAFDYYSKLARVRAYCERHYQDELTLEEVASVAALERTYFSRYFSRKVGVCFSCWLSQLRIAKARKRIETSNVPITRLAQDVGYRNLATFERAFKRCTGMTASDYRQQVRPS